MICWAMAWMLWRSLHQDTPSCFIWAASWSIVCILFSSSLPASAGCGVVGYVTIKIAPFQLRVYVPGLARCDPRPYAI